MMTKRQRRLLAGALGTGLTALLLVLAAFGNLFSTDPRETTTVRAVELYEPPPPAPPPANPNNARSGGSVGRTLTFGTARAPVALQTMQLDVRLAAAEVGPLNLAGLGQGVGLGTGDGTGDGSGTGFGLVTLSELDREPTVVSAPVFAYPAVAAEQGIDEFELEFYILIDEEGRSHPIAMVKNPFPSLAPDFLDYASQVRFTPPTRLGIPVRTEYVWPIKIKR